MSITITTIHPQDLLNPAKNPLLHNINNLINVIYSVHGHPDAYGKYHGHDQLYTEPRIIVEDQLVHELGPEGFVAVCIDDSLPSNSGSVPSVSSPTEYHVGKYGQVVAVASVKPWKGKVTELYKQAMMSRDASGNTVVHDLELAKLGKEYLAELRRTSPTWDWELSTCASVNEARYRGQGLITRSVDALVERLRGQQERYRAVGDRRGTLPIKLWSTALAGSGNIEYWTRRGFITEGGLDQAPKGMWTSTRDFEIQVLSKILNDGRCSK